MDRSTVPTTGKPKPPPPPRSQSLEVFEKGEAAPSGPPQPTSPSMDRLDLSIGPLRAKQPAATTTTTTSWLQGERSEYANLGLQRSGLTPSKPQRTASIREVAAAAARSDADSLVVPPPPPPPPPLTGGEAAGTKVVLMSTYHHPYTSCKLHT
jgi:hypothetical protein